MSDVSTIQKSTEQPDQHGSQCNHGHHGHGWMMMACCVPMLVVAVVLIATGVATFGALFSAIGCLLMMGAMMYAMSRAGRPHGERNADNR